MSHASARDLILYHYPASLFSEKVRVALGMRQFSWHSVEVPPILPRPELMALTGGYRKIPVLQVGADVYCDTELILPVLDGLEAPGPTLSPASGLEWPIVRWVDTAWFQAAVGTIFGSLPDGAVPEEFIRDREQLSGRPFDLEGMRAASPHLRGQFQAGAQWVERRLASSAWLLGDEASAADLAAYMIIWWIGQMDPRGQEMLADLPATSAWAERVAAFGHGEFSGLTAQEALEVAANSEPVTVAERVVVDDGLEVGSPVAVLPDDYGRIPVVGRLLRADHERISVERTADGAGTVAVHFPRTGFVITPADPGAAS